MEFKKFFPVWSLVISVYKCNKFLCINFDEPLARLIKKKKKKEMRAQINILINIKEVIVDSTEVQRIIRNYYKK